MHIYVYNEYLAAWKVEGRDSATKRSAQQLLSMHTDTQTHRHTHTYTYIHTYKHTYINTCICTYRIPGSMHGGRARRYHEARSNFLPQLRPRRRACRTATSLLSLVRPTFRERFCRLMLVHSHPLLI